MTGFGWKEELHSIWAEEEHWDDFLLDPKNKTDYAWFRNHTCHWAPDIEELLGPRLATGKHAHTAQSARTAAAKSNQIPPVPLEVEPTMEDFIDEDGILQRNRFPEGTLLPGDEDYNEADDPFSDLYGVPKPLSSLSSTPTPSQLMEASALKRPRPQGLEKRASSSKRVKVSAGASLSGATIQIADIMGETLAWRKAEFDLGRPEYQRAMDIIYETCQDLVNGLPIRAQIALPGFVKAAIPRMLGSSKTSYATYILDAQASPARRFFIKKMLKDH